MNQRPLHCSPTRGQWHDLSADSAVPVLLNNIPVNLVTGFLGAGKTTLIRHLLASRPAAARWAVLVNEFGEIGIDGALLAGEGIFVKEVPGGCLCCANGVPFRVALNVLLQQARPERLLIEPTGLGHPLQLLAQLTAPEYRDVLLPRATLCVVDPVAARDPRIAQGETFLQQLASADLIVINHADRATPADQAAMDALLAAQGLAAVPRLLAERGVISAALLEMPPRDRRWFLLPPPADSGMRHAGAVFAADVVFPYDDALSLLLALPVQRLKAVLHTDQGWLEINATAAISEWRERGTAQDSRVEVIVADDAGLPELQSILKLLLPESAE